MNPKFCWRSFLDFYHTTGVSNGETGSENESRPLSTPPHFPLRLNTTWQLGNGYFSLLPPTQPSPSAGVSDNRQREKGSLEKRKKKEKRGVSWPVRILAREIRLVLSELLEAFGCDSSHFSHTHNTSTTSNFPHRLLIYFTVIIIISLFSRLLCARVLTHASWEHSLKKPGKTHIAQQHVCQFYRGSDRRDEDFQQVSSFLNIFYMSLHFV
jgi:hypothetical protein